MNIKNNIRAVLPVTFLGLFCFMPFVKAEKHDPDLNCQSNEMLIRNIIIKAEKDRVVKLADSFLLEKPVTVTMRTCPRSAGSIHDYYSEATYWWPDPTKPEGPYIRKDGINNPSNFDYHRQAISQFSWVTGTLTSAYLLTGKSRYAKAAVKHLKAWFVNPVTSMHPNLLFAQAIHGVNTGRGIGIIDAVPFIEVTKSVQALQESPYLTKEDSKVIRQWFAAFMIWLNTHPYGVDEMNAKNNHGTWWHAQVAAYARFVGDKTILEKCRTHYRETLLSTQMGIDGSFPLEIERTKPYSYSLFNLDGMTTLAWLLTDSEFNGWKYTLPDGRNILKGIDFMKPFVIDRDKWPYKRDISHWEEQPGRRPFMIFAALLQEQPEWVTIWQKSSADFPSDESRRNMPLKNPILWFELNRPLN